VARTDASTRVAPQARQRVLLPGRNSWRLERAGRAAVLVDAAEYFKVLDHALRAARRSILIVGWDFDGRIRLCPDDERCPSLGELLRSLVEAQPELTVHVLVWSVAVIHAPGAPLPLLFGADWEQHPRIAVRLDSQHPIYGAHHQKVVVIDDAIAFAGGIDLTVQRWDTCDHRDADPLRVTPDGMPYKPVHDIQMVVDEAAATSLGDLARERWYRATGECLPAKQAVPAHWLPTLAADFVDVEVAIGRTVPAWGDGRAANEVATMTGDLIAAARRLIYIEAQYLTARGVATRLAKRLAEADGPEVVIVLTLSSQGLMERLVMGENRDRLLRRLRRADRHGRLRTLYPTVPAGDGECEVLIHAKLMIVDDTLLRVGSANLNNRSIGLDTECDLAIEASTAAQHRAITALRHRLLGEHLGAAPAQVAAAEAETGSMRGAIERLNCRPRCMRPLPDPSPDGPIRPMPGTWLLDPARPFEPLWFRKRRRRRRLAAPRRGAPVLRARRS
jgi:phosphatidylserine/phosphatidylglycerophosphate/cardiolipin synthase-like enzyme